MEANENSNEKQQQNTEKMHELATHGCQLSKPGLDALPFYYRILLLWYGMPPDYHKISLAELIVHPSIERTIYGRND